MSEEKQENEPNLDRIRVFEDIKRKASEMHNYLKLNQKEYSMDDYLSFALVTMMNACNMIPQYEKPTKFMLNLYIDATLQMEEMKKDMSNGILSIQK